MALKRRQTGAGVIVPRIEALESRQLLSASLVEITIPTTPTPPKHKVVKPKVVHKAVKHPISTAQHAKIGYEVFAG